MGQYLSECYERANQLGGFQAKLMLAKLTLVGSQDAAVLPDSPEYVSKFQKAMHQIESQFKGAAQLDKVK